MEVEVDSEETQNDAWDAERRIFCIYKILINIKVIQSLTHVLSFTDQNIANLINRQIFQYKQHDKNDTRMYSTFACTISVLHS